MDLTTKVDIVTMSEQELEYATIQTEISMMELGKTTSVQEKER